VVPQTLFGILTALTIWAGEEDIIPWHRALLRIPHAAFWVWINLLPFAIDNQRQPAAVLEDKHNKPWRTMPSGRMTSTQAKVVMLSAYPLAICVSFRMGGIRQCLALIALGYGYNDLSLADWHWATRNAINGLGFCSFASGALEVTLAEPLSTRHQGMIQWLGIIGAIIVTTVQLQDMADQSGDRLRDRKTLPLSVGDGLTRWLTALFVLAWTLACPRFWDIKSGPEILLGAIGLVLACSTVALRDIEADKRTFRLWNVWLAGIYMLPLCATVVARAV
jgi:4-hydroxybenzoate polyprenyltransferase